MCTEYICISIQCLSFSSLFPILFTFRENYFITKCNETTSAVSTVVNVCTSQFLKEARHIYFNDDVE